MRLLATPLVKLGQFTFHCTLLPFNLVLKFEVREFFELRLPSKNNLTPIVQTKMVVDILIGFSDLRLGSYTHRGITGTAVVLYEFLRCGF